MARLVSPIKCNYKTHADRRQQLAGRGRWKVNGTQTRERHQNSKFFPTSGKVTIFPPSVLSGLKKAQNPEVHKRWEWRDFQEKHNFWLEEGGTDQLNQKELTISCFILLSLSLSPPISHSSAHAIMKWRHDIGRCRSSEGHKGAVDSRVWDKVPLCVTLRPEWLQISHQKAWRPEEGRTTFLRC